MPQAFPVPPEASDPFLNILVQAAEGGMEAGLTLHVSGVVVSGRMVSMARYLAEMSALIGQSNTALAEGFAELAAGLPDPVSADLAFMDQMPTLDFIHLSGARIHAAGTMLADHPPMLWRGRLDHVSGWSLGTLIPD